MLKLLTIGIVCAGGLAYAQGPSKSARDLERIKQGMDVAQKAALEQAAAAAAGPEETVVDSEQTTESFKETVKVKKRHNVVAANTLWDMAKYYYEDPFKWPVIYEANKHRIKDPHWIYPGQTFIIPGLDKMVTVVKELPQAATPEPEPEPVVEEEQEEPVAYQADQVASGVVVPDDLSVKLPEGLAGQQPSMYRVKMEDEWTPDGSVIEFRGRESMAAAGDMISIRISASHDVSKRQRYTVFRKAAPTESDVDMDAKYYQKVGLIEVTKRLGGGKYRARILKSGGSVQVGDVIKLGS